MRQFRNQQTLAGSSAHSARHLTPAEPHPKGFGVKYGRFVASAEAGRVTAARELLDLVDGTAYLPESLRAAEIDIATDALEAAHNGHNNFYNEPAPARTLAALAGGEGHIPDAVLPKYISVVVKAYLGNGYGVSDVAVPYYERMIGAFDPRQAARALRVFTDPEVSSVLRSRSGERQWTALLDLLGPKLTLPANRALFDAVRAFAGPPHQLHADTNIRRLAGTRRNAAPKSP